MNKFAPVVAFVFQSKLLVHYLFSSFPLQIYLTDLAPPGQWIFPEKLFTDQNEVKIIQDTIFGKLLDNVPYEVPYNVRTEIEYFEIADDGMDNTDGDKIFICFEVK